MKDNCSKHPANVRGYESIEELAEEIGKLNYYSNKKLYRKLAEIYKKQSENDGKIGNKQLSQSLEVLSKAFEGPVGEAIEKVCKKCEKYLTNPYSPSNQCKD
ncbi:MAG: hypothetical protein ACP5NZ_00455 [Nanobdellota archaeon]